MPFDELADSLEIDLVIVCKRRDQCDYRSFKHVPSVSYFFLSNKTISGNKQPPFQRPNRAEGSLHRRRSALRQGPSKFQQGLEKMSMFPMPAPGNVPRLYSKSAMLHW